MLKNVITWARQFESISLEDKEIIMESKKSIIFNGLRNMGKEASNFDIAQGSFDGGLPKHNVLYPPYNANMDTNIGKEFLKLIDD